jgi:hypothetical protein
VRAGRECGDLLVPRLHELDVFAVLVEAAEHPVDPVAGIAVDPVDAVFVESLQYVGADGFGHVVSPRVLGRGGQAVASADTRRRAARGCPPRRRVTPAWDAITDLSAG